MTPHRPKAGAGGRRPRGQTLALNVTLAVIALIALYPFAVMIFGSLKTSGQLAANPGGIPTRPTRANYQHLVTGYTRHTVLRGLLNSILVTVPHTLIAVLLCAMAGYAFAKLRFPGRNILFGLLIASMLIPIEVNIPPLYILFAKIHWLNTYKVQIIPGTANVIGMFLIRQYMTALPDELLEAARLDGASHWRTFWKIAVPLSAPALGAVAILVAIAKWTDYLWPLIMVNDPDKQPIMVLLPTLNTSPNTFTVPIELILAGAAIVTIPLLLLFLRYQDKLMTGTTAGAIK